MTKDHALKLINCYADELKRRGSSDSNLTEMPGRWPSDGGERKAMRWLGYMQGALQYSGVYSLDEIKSHSHNVSRGLAPVLTPKAIP